MIGPKPYLVVGWREIGSHVSHYEDALYESRRDAEMIRKSLATTFPGYVVFVDTTWKIKQCSRCKGTGDGPREDHPDVKRWPCSSCNGLGVVRDG